MLTAAEGVKSPPILFSNRESFCVSQLVGLIFRHLVHYLLSQMFLFSVRIQEQYVFRFGQFRLFR